MKTLNSQGQEGPVTAEIQKSSIALDSRKVFVVHGHDAAAQQELARFLEKLKLEPVILHEQANGGDTVIEKFERYSKEVSFAVILLTPDDFGYVKDDPGSAKLRARQNVILELGYFVGALGRSHVVALVKGNIELPSDFAGVVYEPMDERGAWRIRVAQELRHAGFSVDMNEAF